MTPEADWVVVVGASGAFGQAIVRRVVDAGCRVLAVGREVTAIEPLVERLGASVVPCAADITSDAAIQAIRAALDSGPPPGVVRAAVHGPGVAVAGGVIDAPTQAIVDAVDIKVGGLLRLARAVDDRLVEGSRLVAIAGHYGLEPSPYAAAAGVANAALFNVVRQLSHALGSRGVTAHAIAPGPADTDRLRRVAADRAARDGGSVDDVLAAMCAESSIGQLTTPDQVAWAVTTLLAPEASAMTGSTLMLDAGRRRGLP